MIISFMILAFIACWIINYCNRQPVKYEGAHMAYKNTGVKIKTRIPQLPEAQPRMVGIQTADEVIEETKID
jgi:hypothetical protein